MKIKNLQVIDMGEWDQLVSSTYGRPYCFQQQDDCQERGMVEFTVPAEAEDFENDTIPEVVNGEEMGVSFEAWLAREPTQKIPARPNDFGNDFTNLWWERNFYPNLQMVANDLHAKGLLPAGTYSIDIDW